MRAGIPAVVAQRIQLWIDLRGHYHPVRPGFATDVVPGGSVTPEVVGHGGTPIRADDVVAVGNDAAVTIGASRRAVPGEDGVPHVDITTVNVVDPPTPSLPLVHVIRYRASKKACDPDIVDAPPTQRGPVAADRAIF